LPGRETSLSKCPVAKPALVGLVCEHAR
jgi:hypothetical protein